MNTTKISFGLLIITFAILMIVASVFYQQISSFQKSLLKNQVLTGYTSQVDRYVSFGVVSDFFFRKPELTRYVQDGNECAFVPAEKPTVIIRMDDLGAWHYYDTSRKLVKEFLDRNMSVSLGVIPYELNRDKPFVEWMISIKDNPYVEIAQHGYLHEENEFEDINSIEAYNLIAQGRESIIDDLRTVPITFIPPSNEYNQDTVLALEESGFRIISARNSEYDYNGTVAKIGSDTQTVDYYEKRFIPVEDVIADCKDALETKNLCVIVIHPQDYVQDENPAEIDENKYVEFIRLLDELGYLEADFKKFNDLVSCKEAGIGGTE